MLKKILKIVVLLVILNAVYQLVPPYWRCQRFEAALQDLALASKGRPDATIISEAVELAAAYKITLDREWVAVSRSPDLTHTYIDATWEEPLTPVPGWKHIWVPEVRVDGWHITPPARRELR